MRYVPTSTLSVTLRLLREFLLPRWKGLTVATACAMSAAGFTGWLATLLQPALQPLLDFHAGLGALGKLPLLLAGLALARGLATVGQSMLANRLGLDLVSAVQVRLIGKLMHADLARLRGTHTGGFLSQVLNDTLIVREAATTGFLNYVQQGLTLLILLAVMFTKDWVLTLLVLIGGPVVGWVLRGFSRRSINSIKDASDSNAVLATAILETLGGVRVVKMEGREDFERDRVGRVIHQRRKHMIAGMDAKGAAAPISEFLTMLMIAGVIAYVDWRLHLPPIHIGHIVIHDVTPEAFCAFLVALMAAGQSLRQFATLQTTMAEGVIGARRLFAALDIEPSIRDAPDAVALPLGDGAISFDSVIFGYGEGPPVIKDLTLEARRGEIVALVGPSGGGKSTILSLIPRFYDVDFGRILIDGHDVRGLTLTSLRAQIALVTQEPFLFDDTVRANISYARPGATQAEVEDAARRAAAHEFILELPEGYDTPVGEAGMRLSGGQRQRVAIARAFLKNAPILLLDEATSALDTESEAQVQLALTRLMEGRTTILIAHRLSTVRNADRIYLIDGGRLTETGSHIELVQRGGLYARLAGAQDLNGLAELA